MLSLVILQRVSFRPLQTSFTVSKFHCFFFFSSVRLCSLSSVKHFLKTQTPCLSSLCTPLCFLYLFTVPPFVCLPSVLVFPLLLHRGRSLSPSVLDSSMGVDPSLRVSGFLCLGSGCGLSMPYPRGRDAHTHTSLTELYLRLLSRIVSCPAATISSSVADKKGKQTTKTVTPPTL